MEARVGTGHLARILNVSWKTALAMQRKLEQAHPDLVARIGGSGRAHSLPIPASPVASAE
jgi:hypothetical protein